MACTLPRRLAAYMKDAAASMESYSEINKVQKDELDLVGGDAACWSRGSVVNLGSYGFLVQSVWHSLPGALFTWHP